MEAAHLLDVGASPTPSFFELSSELAMARVTGPAAIYLAKFIAGARPATFGRLLSYLDEIALVVEFLLQRHFLREYNSSFAENFYGLKRAPVGSAAVQSEELSPIGDGAGSAHDVPALSQRQRAASLVMLVILPYMRQKATALWERLRQQTLDGTLPATDRTGWRITFLSWFPVVQSLTDALEVAVHILCLTGAMRPFTTGLWFTGLELVRVSRADYERQTDARKAAVALRAAKLGAAGPIYAALLRTGYFLADATRFALPAGIFFLSFLQWWHSSGHASRANATPVIPPPTPPAPASSGVTLPADPNICPLCREVRTNSAALAASGVVFCYPCLYRYIERYKRCPVTFLPATSDMVIRIHS